MAKKPQRKLFFAIVFLTLLVLSSVCVSLIPCVNASKVSVQDKGLSLLSDVLNLDMTEYAITMREYPQDSYLGVMPQEHV